MSVDAKRLARLEHGTRLFLARQEKLQDARDFTQYADDPEGFIREVLHDTLLWEKPLEIIESVRVNRKTSVRGANSVGKDHTAAELALWWMIAKRGLVCITGPTRQQVFEILFGRELATLAIRGDLPVDVQRFAARPDGEEELASEIPTRRDEHSLKTGILGMVSTDTSKLTGHHAPHVLCIITEAQGVRDLAFNAMYSNATGPNDRLLIVGNPEEDRGEFYQTHRPDSGWYPIRISAHEHPNVVEGRTVIEGGPSREWLEDMRKVHGESSRWWQTYVEAEFPQQSFDVLFPARDLDACVLLHQSGALIEQSRGHTLIVGIDVAKGGGDACGIAVLQGSVYRIVTRFETGGVIETEQKIVEFLRGIRLAPAGMRTSPEGVALIPGVLIIDSAPTGGGPGIIAHLEHDHGYEVIAFNGAKPAQKTDETERYENLRAFGYWSLHLAAQRHEVALPNNALLLEELRATTYKMNAQDGVQITRKPEIRKLLKRSPDLADPVMMAWTVERTGATIGGADPSADYGF